MTPSLTLPALLDAVNASPVIAASSRRAVRSDVGAVLSQMVQHERRATPEEADAILATEDVRPLLARAAAFAHQHFRRRGQLTGGDRNAASRVRQAIRALAPADTVASRPGRARDHALAVDTSWRPLFGAVTTRRAWGEAYHRRSIELVATVLGRAGVPPPVRSAG
jgi:hypothetical protein